MLRPFLRHKCPAHGPFTSNSNASQQTQNREAGPLNRPNHWSSRLMFRLLPFLMRTGIMHWLNRKQFRLMSEGVVPVRLMV